MTKISVISFLMNLGYSYMFNIITVSFDKKDHECRMLHIKVERSIAK